MKPCFFSAATAFDERSPASSYTMSGFSLRLAEVRRALVDARERHVLGAEHMAGAVLARLAHVEHQRVLAVDEVRGLRRRDPRAAGRAPHERPQQHAAGKEGDHDQQQVVLDELHEGRHYNRAMHKLVLLRHGESDWNRENRFTGWTDVDLSPAGIAEAHKGGRQLKADGYAFDIAYTSVLKRAIRTLWIALDELDQMWLPVVKDWRLNERHYGALQGLNKAEMAAKFGEKQVLVWRRSYDTPPPTLEPADPRYEGKRPALRRHQGAAHRVPEGHGRARDALTGNRSSRRTVRSGKRVLIAAHGNSLRALVKHLDGISDEEIVTLNIPTAMPLVYELDDNLKPLKHYYLGDPDEVARRIASVAAQGKAKV